VPDFELFEDGASPDAVPEMLEAWQGSINAGLGGGGNVPALGDVADGLILYHWDGAKNRVQDLDYLIWGSDESVRTDKTSINIGGESYLPDTAVALQEAAAATGPDFGSALRRVNTDEGTEITSGGNGYLDGSIGGHNETSENLATTFPAVVGHEPPAANSPPFPAGPIFTAGGISPTEPYAGQDVTLSVTVMDQDEVEEVVFYYSINGGAAQPMGGPQPFQAVPWLKAMWSSGGAWPPTPSPRRPSIPPDPRISPPPGRWLPIRAAVTGPPSCC
jgi:hypothetical protein